MNRFRLVAADVSRLKFPPIKNERTHVRCYEFHRETTGIPTQDQDSRSAAAGKNRRQRKIAVLHNAVSTSYVVSASAELKPSLHKAAAGVTFVVNQRE